MLKGEPASPVCEFCNNKLVYEEHDFGLYKCGTKAFKWDTEHFCALPNRSEECYKLEIGILNTRLGIATNGVEGYLPEGMNVDDIPWPNEENKHVINKKPVSLFAIMKAVKIKERLYTAWRVLRKSK